MIYYIVKVNGVITQKGFTTSRLTVDMQEVTYDEYMSTKVHA